MRHTKSHRSASKPFPVVLLGFALITSAPSLLLAPDTPTTRAGLSMPRFWFQIYHHGRLLIADRESLAADYGIACFATRASTPRPTVPSVFSSRETAR